MWLWYLTQQHTDFCYYFKLNILSTSFYNSVLFYIIVQYSAVQFSFICFFVHAKGIINFSSSFKFTVRVHIFLRIFLSFYFILNLSSGFHFFEKSCKHIYRMSSKLSSIIIECRPVRLFGTLL